MRITAIALIVSLFTLGSGSAFALPSEAAMAAKEGQETSDWRKVADAVPLGSKVRVQRLDGSRISGTLMRVDSSEVLVKKNTRFPEPAVAVPFTDIAKLERHKDGGLNLAKVIAIGVASGAGAMLTLILFAMQLD